MISLELNTWACCFLVLPIFVFLAKKMSEWAPILCVLEHALRKRNLIHQLKIQKLSNPTCLAEKCSLYLFCPTHPFLYFSYFSGAEVHKIKTHFFIRCKRYQLTLVMRNFSKQDWCLKKLSSNSCSARFEWTCIYDMVYIKDMIYHSRKSKAESLACL